MADETNEEMTLRLLNAIEQNEFHSQRTFASRLGIALGLTNAYIRRCIRKGWIKMSKAPARRYAYYLTPTGFAEKSRLTADYLTRSFLFFREARTQCLELLRQCESRGWRRVILYGEGDLMEIATLAVRETGIELAGVVAPGSRQTELGGVPILQGLDGAPPFDALLLTETHHPQQVLAQLLGRLDADRILIPALLMVVKEPVKAEARAGATR